MSLNVPFAGTIVDINLNPVPYAYIQALYVGDDGIKLWDSSVRQVGSDGIYNLNIGDDTFATVSNYVDTNGKNGKLLLNAWSGVSNVRTDVHELMGSTYVIMDGSSVYVNNIQILPVSPLQCGNWTIDNQYFVGDLITSTSQNTNEHSYLFEGRTHYQYRLLDGEIIFDSLGVKSVKWDFGTGFTTSGSYIYSSSGYKTVYLRVEDLYYPNIVECSREIQIFSQVSGTLNWLPNSPLVGEEVVISPSVFGDYTSITNVKYIVNGAEIYSGVDYYSPVTYVPTSLGNDVIEYVITYYDGFTTQVWRDTYEIVKTNVPPNMNLEVIEPIADDRYTFIHNGTDVDGYVAEVNYIIEKNNKDIYNNDNWTLFYQTGRILDLSNYTYDFAQESGDFRVTVVVYDDYGASVSQSYGFQKLCKLASFDISNCDWSKRVVVNNFSITPIKKTFVINRVVKKWEINVTRIEWTVKRNITNWDINTRKLEFKVRGQNG